MSASEANLAGWRRFVRVSTEHEVIGVQFLVASLAFFLIGGALALAIRIEQSLAGVDLFGAGAYDRLFSNHGSIMVFLWLLPAVAGLTHAILPETMGVDRAARPKLSALAFWFFALSGLIMLASFFVGAATAGWTAYAPLSVEVPELGQTFWAVSLILLLISLLLSAINFAQTIRGNHEGEIWNLPQFATATLISSIMAIVSSPVLLLALVLLVVQRLAGSQISLLGSAVGVTLWQNFFWFFAHPATLIVLIPIVGVISEVIQKFSRRPLVAYRSIGQAMAVIGGLGLLSWGQHLFASGLMPNLRIPFMIASMLVAIPIAFIFAAWIATIWLGRVRFETPMIFALGFITLLLLGGLSGLMLAAVPIDLQLHDSYFVVGHLHIMFLGGVISGLYAAMYYWYPKIAGKQYDETLGILHALGHIGGVFVSYFPMFVLGLLGLRRRVFDFPALAELEILQFAVTAGSIMLAGSALLFLYNLFFSLLRGGSVDRAEMSPGWDFQPIGEQDPV